MTNKQFPEKFIFGTVLASYQMEGGIYSNDWTHWENKKDYSRKPHNSAYWFRHISKTNNLSK